jgi:hypothetical protein
MYFPRSKFLLLISFFFFTILLAIFTVQIFEDRSHERSSKGDGPLPLENPVPERRESTFYDRKDRLGVEPRWNHFLQSPEEVLSERRWTPRNDVVLWEEIQEDLALIIEEKFPELRLSKKDLGKLTETIRTIQESMQELREFERTRGKDEAIKQIHHQLNRALEVFEEITEMNVSEFISLGRPESGIDNGKPDHEEIVNENIRDRKS